MAAWGYEFYLLVLKLSLTSERSETRERYFQHEQIKFVSPSGHVISSIWKSVKRACSFIKFPGINSGKAP